MQPSQSNWNFPDFPPVPLSKPELLKLTMIMKLKLITLFDDKDATFHLDRKKKKFLRISRVDRHVPCMAFNTTHVKPQVAQARNMSIGDKRYCCVTFEI